MHTLLKQHDISDTTLEYVAKKFERKGYAKEAHAIAELVYEKLGLQKGQCVQGLLTGNLLAMFKAHLRNKGEDVSFGVNMEDADTFARMVYTAIDFARA